MRCIPKSPLNGVSMSVPEGLIHKYVKMVLDMDVQGVMVSSTMG